MKYITVSPILEKAVRDKIETTLEICRKKYGKPLPMPTLRFRQSGLTAGYYQPPGVWSGKSEMIVINPDYFKNHYDEQLNDTVPHEVAHYVTRHVFGKVQTHGREWASVMNLIGIPADRCHTFSLEGVKTRKVEKPYHYTCGCSEREHTLTKLRHNKCQSNLIRCGKTAFSCRTCGKSIVYKGFTHNGTFIPAKKPASEPVKEVPSYTFNLPVVPRPVVTVTEPQQTFKTVTKFVNGMLTNVKVPIAA